MQPVSTRGTCSPDIAMLCNYLLAVVEELQAMPQWFVGPDLPDDSVGKDGDFYLDTDTGDVYWKEDGSWL